MRFFLLTLVLFTFSGLNLYSQDTLFSRTEKEYQLVIKKGGYHIYAILLKRNIGQIDTVFRYDYGVYKGMDVKDAVMHDNIFMCVYRSMNGLFFINSAFKDGKWSPLLGGYLFFLAPREKDNYQVSIKSKRRVEVRQGDKGKKNTYLYDYNKKTVSVKNN
jgi:hypothetical protein